MPTLNVILHGLFALIEEPYRLVAAVPAILDHQTYLIGVESDTNAAFYGRGTYELLGLPPANLPASVPGDLNAKIRGCEVLATAPPARSVFILPRPQQVFSCRCMNFGTDMVFFGNDAAEITTKLYATINILSYSFQDIDDLQFAGLPDLDFYYSDSSEQYVNVGITSTGAHQDMTAVSAAFDKMMGDLIPSKDIHLFQINPSPNPTVPCLGIPGITARTFELLLQLQLNASVDDCVPLSIDNT